MTLYNITTPTLYLLIYICVVQHSFAKRCKRLYMRIFILNENELSSSLIKKTLDRNGHEVTIFNDSVEFYDQVVTQNPDLVIIDLLISYITGYDLINRIRAIKGKYIQIIVLSKVNAGRVIEEAFRLGVDDYITFPLRIAELDARIGRLNRYNLNKLSKSKSGALRLLKADHVPMNA